LIHPYNEYLEHLVDGGILGFGLFVVFLGLLLVSLFRMWQQRHHPEVRVMGLAILVSILTAGFHELFDFALRTPANGFIFVLILALGFKMVLYKRKFRHET
jgi:O-antigen ligase